jgi:hypothetical protein
MYWSKVYSLPFSITLDNNLRYFLYIILHRILNTNVFLNIIEIRDDDVCSVCNSETLILLFVECIHVSDLWLKLKTWSDVY